MDKLDKALLKELMQNSRASMTQLAKRCRVSREVATYRMSRLKKENVIINFVTEINMNKLGFIGAAVFANVKATRQGEFKEYLAHSSFVSWVAELSGVWSFGFSIIGKTNEELDEKFAELYGKFKQDIIDHRFTLHKQSIFFYEKYLEHTPKKNQKKKEPEYKIDKKDKIILQQLAKNSRIDYIALSKEASLTSPAVAQRIKHLEKSGYIIKYSLFLDISKLNLFQYSIFIINKNIDEKKKLMHYLTEHKNVAFIAEYVGDPFIEFGVFVNDPYELRKKLQQIEEAFPENKVIEVSLFQKEFVSIGPPACVFE